MPTYKDRKSKMVWNWKNWGVKYKYGLKNLWDLGESTTHCENCGVLFGVWGDGTNSWRCMDHDHKTGLFRAFLCNKCNYKDRAVSSRNKFGISNLSYRKIRNTYRIRIKYKISKSFKSYYEAVIYRWLLKELYDI